VTIGQRLREARLRRELDIADAETYTKIRAKYLRALENDEFAALPDRTLVKTFLRTYSEYLGLDAQLLAEEYRAQHEPRGEGDIPKLAPRRAREPRQRGGPPIGPGGAFAIGIVLLLVLFAVLGLTGGDDKKKDDGKSGTASTQKQTSAERKAARERKQRRERRQRRAKAATRTLSIRVVPAGPTYVCVDDGQGKVTFEGTIAATRTFRAKRRGRLRINLGRPGVRLTANGKRIRVPQSASGNGFSFSRTGRATPLPLGRRPCA
jgi:cytoskeleton protein RodZ